MKVIKAEELEISALVQELKHGATLVYPTETCYGLGCDATNTDAVKRIYEIKGRTKEKPLILLADSLEMMAPYIEVTPRLEQIEKKYWPGALTVVVPASATPSSPPPSLDLARDRHRGGTLLKKSLPYKGRVREGSSVKALASGVFSADGTIAFRVTSHPLARKIVQALGRPLVSTSANVAGENPPYAIGDILHMWEGKDLAPDIAIDAGVLPKRPPSTVVRLLDDRVEVVRQGAIVVN